MLAASGDEQPLLRAAALWAADAAELALPIVHRGHPGDTAADQAIAAARAFGNGKRRDKALRVLAMAAFRQAGGKPEPARHAFLAASLSASIAYTHTDLHTGQLGVRQARHLLGPVVHAALAIETDTHGGPAVSDEIIAHAVVSAPTAVIDALIAFPTQPAGRTRLDALLQRLDDALRRRAG